MGPPTCGTMAVTIGQTCMSLIRAAGMPPISTVGQPIMTAVVIGMPLAGLAPVTKLVTRAAGRPPIKTVIEPIGVRVHAGIQFSCEPEPSRPRIEGSCVDIISI